MKFASVVTGTSTDGLSMSLVEITGFGTGTTAKVIGHSEIPFPDDLRSQLLRISSMKAVNSESVSRAHWELGRFIGQALLDTKWDPDAVAFSGYTIYHGPSLGRRSYGTLQIGEASEIFAATGKTVLSDFRATDMSMGGDGAPLIPLSDSLLFGERGTLTLNIGGISNITYIGDKLLAFDTGPGNLLIDAYMMEYFGRAYDKDGKTAKEGKVNATLLDRLMDDPYFAMAPPKSTGREYFSTDYVQGKLSGLSMGREDIIANLTAFTSRSICDQIRRFVPGKVERIIAGGGGCLNPAIMEDISLELDATLKRFSDFGIDDKAREGVGFAVIANQTLYGLPGNTEASGGKPAVLGRILPGNNYDELIAKARRFPEGKY